LEEGKDGQSGGIEGEFSGPALLKVARCAFGKLTVVDTGFVGGQGKGKGQKERKDGLHLEGMSGGGKRVGAERQGRRKATARRQYVVGIKEGRLKNNTKLLVWSP
jgi:hypothetical protein